MFSILLVDDELDWLYSLKLTITQCKLAESKNVHFAQNSDEALSVIQKIPIDLILLDLMLKNERGEDILKKIKRQHPAANVVIMTGVSNFQSAVNCIELGAMDYFVKAACVDELTSSIKRTIDIIKYEKQNKLENINENKKEYSDVFDAYVTKEQDLFNIFRYLTAVAQSSEPVLITGESGVGKGIIAECLGKIACPGKPFVQLNVAGLDSEIFSDTLFGHVAGAFTNAYEKRAGMVAQADGGVLFLDEIGDIDTQSQIKLLYLTQSGEYQQLGSDKVLKSNIKLICATNQNLEQKIEEGTFRKDLYFRLKTHMVHIPPLRERSKDIEVLMPYFVRQASAYYNHPNPAIDKSLSILLQSYSFPGNIRELRSMVFDVMAEYQRDILTISDFKKYFINKNSDKKSALFSEKKRLPKVETVINELVDKALELTNGNQSKAAAMIGLSQSTLSKRLKKEK